MNARRPQRTLKSAEDLVAAGLLLAEGTALTAEARADHHLLREHEYVFRQFRVDVVGCPVAMARSRRGREGH